MQFTYLLVLCTMWLFWWPTWLNDLSHFSHLNGFSPPWSLECIVRLDFVVSFLPHCWQGKAQRVSSSVCTLMWDFRSDAVLNDMVWHRTQGNGFLPVWIWAWFSRFLWDKKVFLHVIHIIFAVLSTWTILCFLTECLRLKVCSQRLQENGRASPCCSSSWIFRWLDLPKLFPQREHWKFLSPSWKTEKCLFM